MSLLFHAVAAACVMAVKDKQIRQDAEDGAYQPMQPIARPEANSRPKKMCGGCGALMALEPICSRCQRVA